MYVGLADGSLDIVLTTPEYLMFHTDELAASGRVGFVVVDEAHHIGQAKAGQRVAYTQLDRALTRLGDPVVLAVTATANDAVADDIDAVLPIQDSTTCTWTTSETSRTAMTIWPPWWPWARRPSSM